MSDDDDKAARIARNMGVGGYRRHFFICVGPDCCSSEQGMASWEYLKRRLKELNLVAPAGPLYRTKVGCLRICIDGPTGVVYPEGIWYRHLTPGNIERVLQEHILGGCVVQELKIGENPLFAGE